nr:flagellar hook assembly protein FlgD [Virgibacillus sp. Bac330]
MAKIDPSLYLHNQKERTPSPDLGKDEFLNILMTQLKNQDPTNPMDDRQFVSQMAEFSSLEQMMKMSKSINTLVESQLVSPVIKYSHMLGKEVTYQGYDEETELKTSRVVAVSQNEGWAILELENGEKIYADAALQVNDPAFEETEDK